MAGPILSSFQILIVDPNSSSRNAIRQILFNMGAKTAAVTTVERYDEALKRIDQALPDLLIVENQLGTGPNDRSGTDVVHYFRDRKRNFFEASTILVSHSNSPAMAALVAEQGIDALLVKPFTADSLTQCLSRVILSKQTATSEQKELEEARIAILECDFDRAAQLLENAKSAIETSACMALTGQMKVAQGQVQEGINAFKKGLDLNPSHYRCLVGLVDYLPKIDASSEAYPYLDRLMKEFPLSPSKIPQAVRICIQASQFGEMKRFIEFLEQLGGSTDTLLLKHLAAGSVVASKALLRSNHQAEAIQLLKKAASLSFSYPHIYREAMVTLLSIGQSTEVDLLMKKMPEELRNHPEIKMVNLEFAYRVLGPGPAYQLAQEALQAGKVEPRIYEILIGVSRQMGRNPDVVQALFQDACQKYPESKANYVKAMSDSINRK